MVVTLGTLETDAEKQLCHQRRNFVRRTTIAKQRGGTVVPRAALRRNQLTDKLIVGFVLAEAVANPMVVVQHRLDAHAIRIRA